MKETVMLYQCGVLQDDLVNYMNWPLKRDSKGDVSSNCISSEQIVVANMLFIFYPVIDIWYRC